jgi:hypothetical protein
MDLALVKISELPDKREGTTLPGVGDVPYKDEGHQIEGVAMNWVLIVLQIAVLVTLLFAYGRK